MFEAKVGWNTLKAGVPPILADKVKNIVFIYPFGTLMIFL